MRLINCEQGSPRWHAARRGRITASRINVARGRRKKKTRDDYIRELVLDLEGVDNFDEAETPPYFAAGKYYESFALGWYEWNRDCDVTKFGFCVHDQFDWLGCSPDGQVTPKRGIEIKHRSYLRTYKANVNRFPKPPEYAQMQCQMWVMGWDSIDYLNYWRDDENEIEQGNVQRIMRDDAYIDSELYENACQLWADVLAEYKRRNGEKPFAIDLRVAA